MRGRYFFLAVLGLGLGGCAKTEAPLAEDAQGKEQRAKVEGEVREFVARVADDVTREGPLAWKKEFAEGPEFFMASEGKLAFADGQAASQGIDGVAKLIRKIELKWGEDLRVDVLTPKLAAVGTSWRETQEMSDGKTVSDSGYFTGVAEKREGRWVFRDAHWSTEGTK